LAEEQLNYILYGKAEPSAGLEEDENDFDTITRLLLTKAMGNSRVLLPW
jgi:hypothetical protein